MDNLQVYSKQTEPSVNGTTTTSTRSAGASTAAVTLLTKQEEVKKNKKKRKTNENDDVLALADERGATRCRSADKTGVLSPTINSTGGRASIFIGTTTSRSILHTRPASGTDDKEEGQQGDEDGGSHLVVFESPLPTNYTQMSSPPLFRPRNDGVGRAQETTQELLPLCPPIFSRKRLDIIRSRFIPIPNSNEGSLEKKNDRSEDFLIPHLDDIREREESESESERSDNHDQKYFDGRDFELSEEEATIRKETPKLSLLPSRSAARAFLLLKEQQQRGYSNTTIM